MDRIFGGVGALAGLSAVALSAVAAHLPMDAAANAMLRDAVQMQGWHALALLFLSQMLPRTRLLGRMSGCAFLFGLAAFCGTIYLRVFAGLPLTFLAPYGGTAFMLGWAMLALALIRR